MQNYYLPLKAPNPLPASGVDVVTFKVWKNTLVAHIQQDANHFNFMPGGRYSTWQARSSGPYFGSLDDEDPDKKSLDEKRNGAPPTISATQYTAKIEELLNKRNAQVAKFITHIATLVHSTEHDDVTNESTSLEWIFSYLQRHYGIETKGANFMKISEHIFKKGTPYQTFYKQYRASFLDNLRKKNDKVMFKNGTLLTEDEQLSPSFENAIVLWTLEKIDPRLPAKVKKNYGHQMTGNVTLRDIQPVVFENIADMLEELDNSPTTSKAFAIRSSDETVMDLNAIVPRGRGGQSFRGRRGDSRGNGSNRSFVNRNQGRLHQNITTDKFCRICNLAGSDPRIYTSHEIGNCTRLTIKDLESLRKAFTLNGMILGEEESEEPAYFLQPGWDDEEAQSLDSSTHNQD